MASGDIILQGAVNIITATVYIETDKTWLPREFIFASTCNKPPTSNSMVDIEHFYVPVVHPDTGEIITQYKRLQADHLLQKL